MTMEQDLGAIVKAESDINGRHDELSTLTTRLQNECESVPHSVWQGGARQSFDQAVARLHDEMRKTNQSLAQIAEVMQGNRKHVEEEIANQQQSIGGIAN
ncbi:WXG100 family type VII secretion target [Mycobacteroides immunogenum]|nr:WXG100 family type VII secretion target [Mycobacteroides immunogenum]MCV7305925.1 WXG100 family type VII secretion target [Mycobacteroides immunogenum]WJR32803.1 WXG100 family type VII secretion target [Mycobacteroides immunogenum]